MAPDYYEQREFTIMITLNRKYLQHSYSKSFMFQASYPYCSSFLTAATYVVVNVVTTYTKLNGKLFLYTVLTVTCVTGYY